MKSAMIGGLFVQFPWIYSCENNVKLPVNLAPLTKTSFLNLKAILDVLFPDDGDGPSASEVNADTYILWVLNDQNLDPRENSFITEKLDKFSNDVFLQKNKQFYLLSGCSKETVVAEFLQHEWADRFFSRLLTLIFESVLSHPLYNVNPDEIGWKWLEHDPGSPKADKLLSYPGILNLKNEI